MDVAFIGKLVLTISGLLWLVAVFKVSKNDKNSDNRIDWWGSSGDGGGGCGGG